VRRNLVAVREGHDQPHAEKVVGHARPEIQPVAREIDYVTHIFDSLESGIEWPHMHRQGRF
jgi:hypothetical protein